MTHYRLKYDNSGKLSGNVPVGAAITNALNRVTRINYADSTSTTFQYDLGPYGLGRLKRVFDASGNTLWNFDSHGRIIQKRQQVGTLIQTVSYSYNNLGQLTSMTYPSGKLVSYTYTQEGLSGINVDGQSLIKNLQYQASARLFSGLPDIKSWQWGNNLSFTRSYDTDGRLTSLFMGYATTLGYDDNDRITSLNVPIAPALNQSFAYDALDRLNQYITPALTQGYTYDPDGNRKTHTRGPTTYTYSYPASSNRLSQFSGPAGQTYAYDAAGNTLTDGNRTYTYNAQGCLSQVSAATLTTSYAINGLGQRVRKSDSSATTHFVHDESGQLIGEYDASGNPIAETIYLGSIPVGLLQNGTLYYIYADHLNTPKRISHPATGKILWRWDNDPFGTTLPNEDQDGDGIKLVYNLRFPGQYYDKETGLHYNYFRDYDPRTGRYRESDPIGLGGGVNTYGYVGGNPLSFVDPTGEASLKEVVQAIGVLIGLSGIPGIGPDNPNTSSDPSRPSPTTSGQAIGQRLPDPSRNPAQLPQLPRPKPPIPGPSVQLTPGSSPLPSTMVPGFFRPPFPFILCPACSILLPNPAVNPQGC